MTEATNIRQDVTLAAVLESVASVVRNALTLTESTCFWCTDAAGPPPPASGDIFAVITPDGGDFDETMFDGGCIEQLTVTTGIVVTLWNNIRLDREGRDDESLLNRQRGSIVMLTPVIKALAGTDLLVNGALCLRELLRPRGYAIRKHNEHDHLSGASVTFDLSFDWNMAD